MFTRSPNMDQIIQKLQRQRKKNPTPSNERSLEQSRPGSNQTSNKDLQSSFLRSHQLNRSCNYHYSQLHQRLQSRNGTEVKKKLLNDSTQSNVSTSYLISTLKDKIGKRVQTNKYNTTEDGSSFTVISGVLRDSPAVRCQQDMRMLQANLTEEVNILKGQLDGFAGFQLLLERMEHRETSHSITIFGELRRLFSNLVLQITSQMNVQNMEIDTLCRQNVDLKQQIVQHNQQMHKLQQLVQLQQRQLKNRSEDTILNIMNTLRSNGVDPKKMLIKRTNDTVDTYKLKQQQELEAEEYQKNSSEEDSFPFVDPSTINQPMQSKGLSLNLNPLKDPMKAPIGYQDEFMANINEFSESWRQQALAEKRF